MRENFRALFLLCLVLSGQVELIYLGNDKKKIFCRIRSVIELIIILVDKFK